MKLKYNIHHAINMRSFRKGLVNDFSLNYSLLNIQFKKAVTIENDILSKYKNPSNNYGIYYPNIYGKNHSKYKKY